MYSILYNFNGLKGRIRLSRSPFQFSIKACKLHDICICNFITEKLIKIKDLPALQSWNMAWGEGPIFRKNFYFLIDSVEIFSVYAFFPEDLRWFRRFLWVPNGLQGIWGQSSKKIFIAGSNHWSTWAENLPEQS